MDLVISYTFTENELSDMVDNIQQQIPELDGANPELTLKTYLDSQEYHPVTSNEFPDVEFVVYDTSEGGMNKIILKQVN